MIVKKNMFLTGILLTVLLFSCGCGRENTLQGNDCTGDGAYLLTIDGYGVTEEEYLLFLRDQKAVTANYFWKTYQMQPDDGFWTTKTEEGTPLEYAKERALSAVIFSKEEFVLAAERGILEYQNYGEMMDDMKSENEKRVGKKEDGSTFYGVSEFNPFTYYQYINGNVRSALERSQEELSTPTREQLKKIYEENKENLTLGTVYEYVVLYEDGRTEEVIQNTREIGKEDTTSEDLMYNYFVFMEPGDTIDSYFYHGEDVMIGLRSVESLGYLPFEEAEESLRVFYARSELNDLISEMAENAKIEFDQERYDVLEMP